MEMNRAEIVSYKPYFKVDNKTKTFCILVEEFRAALEHENSASGLLGEASNSNGDKKRKKKSRWASLNDGNEKTFIPGMPTILPSNLNPDQQEAYLGNCHNSLLRHFSTSNSINNYTIDDHKFHYTLIIF